MGVSTLRTVPTLPGLVLACLLCSCGDDDSGSLSRDSGSGEHEGGMDAGPVAPPDASDDAVVARDADDPDTRDVSVPCVGGVLVTHVTGRIVDESASPVEGAAAQLCARVAPADLLMCLEPAFADASGRFAIEVPSMARCLASASLRVRLPATSTATTYCPVTLDAVDGRLALERDLVLFAPSAPRLLPPEGDPAQVRTVVLDDGLEIDLAPDDLGPGADYTSLAARRIALDAVGLCFLADAPALDGLYAFAPESTLAGAGAPLRIPNVTGIAAGADVELYLLGGLDSVLSDGRTIDEAAFERFGRASVSADGATIATAPGTGLPYLSWLGYRAAR